MQFLLFLVKARETGRHLRAALVHVLLAVDLLLSLFQQLQHSTDDGLQRAAQVFPAVRLSERRHVNKGRAPVAQVEGCVVGKITEVPIRSQTQQGHRLLPHQTQPPSFAAPGCFPGYWYSPSCVFGDWYSHSQPGGGHSLADRLHVDDRVDAVGASDDAALGVWAEAAVVQASVAVISATLFKRDSSGHSWHPDVNY